MSGRLLRAALVHAAVGAAGVTAAAVAVAAGAGCAGEAASTPGTGAGTTGAATASAPAPASVAATAAAAAAPPGAASARPGAALRASATPFDGFVALPDTATLATIDERVGVYDVGGSLDDLIAFYAASHPDAARTPVPHGVILTLSPPGADRYVVRLLQAAPDRNRIIISVEARGATAPASAAP